MRHVSVGTAAPAGNTRQGRRLVRSARPSRLVAVVSACVCAAGVLAAFVPASALAASCTDSWASPVSGEWKTASNWSTGKVPGSIDEVCITVPGTYTVTLASAVVEIKSLTLGATSGAETQTLLLGGVDPYLGLAANSKINQKGVLDWEPEHHEPGFFSHIVAPASATIENLGKVTAPVGNGTDHLQANFTNAAGATFEVQSGEVIQENEKTFTNEGTLQVDSGALYELYSANTFVNDGAVVDNGRVYFDGGALRPSWTENGTESGNAVQLNEVHLIDTSGNGGFDLINADTIAGVIAAGQTVTSEDFTFVSGTVTNHGTLALNPTLSTKLLPPEEQSTGGQIQNDGLVTSQGRSFLQIPLTNASGATVEVKSGELIEENDVTLTNEGAFEIASGTTFNVISGSGFVNSASGTLVVAIPGAAGFGAVSDSGTFNAGGTIFPKPVGGYVPPAGAELNVITTLAPGTISGTFASVANGFEADYSKAGVIAVRLAGSGAEAAAKRKAEEEAAAKKAAEEAAAKKKAEEAAAANKKAEEAAAAKNRAEEAGASVKIEKVKVTASSIVVTIKTSQAGTVTITGPALKKTVKTLGAGTHVVTVALTKAGRAERRARKKIKLTATLKVGSRTVASSLRIKL